MSSSVDARKAAELSARNGIVLIRTVKERTSACGGHLLAACLYLQKNAARLDCKRFSFPEAARAANERTNWQDERMID
jgi:hypothetical protein